jgi:NAD(P)H dehydrogenase (quinone)
MHGSSDSSSTSQQGLTLGCRIVYKRRTADLEDCWYIGKCLCERRVKLPMIAPMHTQDSAPTTEFDKEFAGMQVPETLSKDVLEMKHAPHKPQDHAIISANQLTEADGLVFAFPTHFGAMPAQIMHFFATTSDLWKAGSLISKPVTLAVSSAAQVGGQETTLLSAATHLTHHGAIFVPFGYTAADILLAGCDEVRGGGPWGAGTLAGADGLRTISATELELAHRQGVYFAGKVKKLAL